MAKGRRVGQSRVSVKYSVCLYEAVFALWEQFSATLHKDETKLLRVYVSTARGLAWVTRNEGRPFSF